MINLIRDFPVTTITAPSNTTEKKIKEIAYTKEEVNVLIDAAVEKAVAAVSYTHLTLPTKSGV